MKYLERGPRRRWWLWLAAGVTLCAAGSASAYVTLDRDRTRWSDDPTFRILNDLEGSNGAGIEALRAAVNTWTQVSGANITPREVNSGGDITLEFSDDWPPEVGPSAAGVALTRRSSGRITSSEILINTENFEWSTTPNSDDTDVQGVATHEVGHALGLDHSYLREATMYWSGGDQELRTLTQDDQNGLRFLYGGADQGLGRLCDTCLSDDDCANGGVCIGLEDNAAFCGVPCTGGCPEGASCYSLQNSDATQCVPDALFCSDDGGDGLQQGEYCWGAEQCSPGGECLPLPNGTAECTRECTSDAQCPGGACLGAGNGQPGICVSSGEAAYGEECASDLGCATLLCLPLADDLRVCSQECDPDRPNCPGGDECLALPDTPGIDGICIPSGDVGEGGSCGGFVDRCMSGLTCVEEGFNNGVCRAACEPFGQCADNDRACVPFSGDSWFCQPSDNGLQEGDTCQPGQDACAGGLLCVPVSGSGLCFRICDATANAACGGDVACLQLEDGDPLGICSVGEATLGQSCVGPVDCRSFECIAHDGAAICTQPCDNGACPIGWTCQDSNGGGRLCFPEDGTPVNNGANNGGNNGGNNGDANNGGNNGANNGDNNSNNGNNGDANNGDNNNGDGFTESGGGGGSSSGCQAAPGVAGGGAWFWLGALGALVLWRRGGAR